MELGIYVIKRNKDFFKVDEENTFMDFLQTGFQDDVITNTLYSLASYELPIDAIELYMVGLFDTRTGYISVLSSNPEEIAENDNITPFFGEDSFLADCVKVCIDLKPYEHTYQFFVSEIKKYNEKHNSTDNFRVEELSKYE